MKAILAAALVAAVTVSPALAHEATPKRAEAKLVPQKPHSGGTDSKGCHTNHKTGEYHCHKPK